MKYTGKVVDAHLHMRGGFDDLPGFLEGTEKLRLTANCDMINVQSIPQWDMESIGQNMVCILLKMLYPNVTYAFGGVDFHMPKGLRREDFEKQAENLVSMGFDGIKIIEGKPAVRRNIGEIALNSPIYDGFYNYLEKNKIPIMLHVADPETFWDNESAPSWAKENGWLYGDGSFPEKEQLYSEAEDVFTRYPELKLCLAHFYFLSNDIERAARILDKYPNVMFDITPGTEMYGNFSKRADEWRDFFTGYSDRILFGTDNGWGTDISMQQKIDNAVYNVAAIRRFLETGDEFEAFDLHIKGINLDIKALKNIYFANHKSFVGEIKPVNREETQRYFKKMVEIFNKKDVPNYNLVYPQMKHALEIIEALK